MRRVIVVETDEKMRERICTCLLAEGREVVSCGTREGAVELLRLGADVLLLGGTQPSSTGLSILDEIKASKLSIPTVVVAGSTEQALGALKAGAMFVTRAPSTAEELSFLTGRALETMPESRPPPAPTDEAEPVGGDRPSQDFGFVELEQDVVVQAIRHAVQTKVTRGLSRT